MMMMVMVMVTPGVHGRIVRSTDYGVQIPYSIGSLDPSKEGNCEK